MVEKVKLSGYFQDENIIAKEDIYPTKPSPNGLIKLKEKLGLKDYQMLYVGDGLDDYLAAKGANVFFAMITQGLVRDIDTIRRMKQDFDFGGAYVTRTGARIPKFFVAFNFNELSWWFKEFKFFERGIKAVCFDLGDTIIVGGREEAYNLTDKNWPTWAVDTLMEEKKAEKRVRDAVMKMRVGERWRAFGEFPGMNSSEARVASLFLLEILELKEKDLISVLYSEIDKDMIKVAEELSKRANIVLNTSSITDDMKVKDVANLFLAEQYSLFIGGGLYRLLEEKRWSLEEVALIILSSFHWIDEYRKNEVEAYRKHCKIPKGLKEFLDLLDIRRKKICIFTSKSRGIVDAVLGYEKEITND
ncbi:MAG: HAD family hydrolase [Candidatus Altiarchaeota archaeon]|nr:HAD family hydrolase [Candidatus Altiarchaeota archaeon]